MSLLDTIANEMTVLILGGGRGSRLEPLTDRRSKPAVPIAGKYRLIDVAISNAINSHMERMYVLTQFNSVSLHRHIGRTYRFDSFSRGYVQILAAQQTPEGEKWFQGTADAVRRNISAFKELQGDHILILAGDHLYRMDYRQLLSDHIESNADITIGVKSCSADEISEFGAARVDSTGQIREFREKPADEAARAGMEVDPSLLKAKGVEANYPYLASMGIYMFKKEALLDVLASDMIDFGGDIIPASVDTMKVQAHFFKGYWKDIGTIRAFFNAHMDLVKMKPQFTFHDRTWPIYTRPRFLPGARIHECMFKSALLGDGSMLENSTVEEAVIGLRSAIHGASIRRCLVMGADSYYPDAGGDEPPVGIGEGSVIENAIIDKNARIGRNVRIINAEGVTDKIGDGWRIRDGIVVIPKSGIIPDNTVI